MKIETSRGPGGVALALVGLATLGLLTGTWIHCAATPQATHSEDEMLQAQDTDAEVASEDDLQPWRLAPPPPAAEGTRGALGQAVYEAGLRSVVLIQTKPPGARPYTSQVAAGEVAAGVLLTDEGLILTTAKLLTTVPVDDNFQRRVYVGLDPHDLLAHVPAYLYKWDLERDLALLKVDGDAVNLSGRAVKLFTSRVTGTTAHCIGHGALNWQFKDNVTIEGESSSGQTHPLPGHMFMKTDTTCAALTGGAVLVNDRGELVGINVRGGGDGWALSWSAIEDFCSAPLGDEPLVDEP